MPTRHTRPRLTHAVRDGWDEIRALVTCELENGQISQFECREHNRQLAAADDPEEVEAPDPETCPCEGCTAARHRVTHRTARNWVLHGVRGVRLGARPVGGRWHTTEGELAEFLRALELRAPGPAPPVRTPARRRREHERACAELDRLGIR